MADKVDQSLERFQAVPRIGLSNLQTPIERCERLRKLLPGAPHLYIKRDDHLGYLIGGNKLRKLEYVMADVLAKRATTVLTVGSLQSNHARVTAMAAKRLGLNCILVLNGELPEEPRGNFLIDRLLGVTVHIVRTRDERTAMMDAVANDLERKGERVYRIPLGASNEIGALGLVAALEETFGQQRPIGVNFDAIVFASSSGGTQAGFEVGKRLLRLEGLQLLGVSPDDPAESIKDSVIGVMRPMLSRLGLEPEIDRSTIRIDDQFVGVGYGIPTEASAEAVELFAQVEGILLDPFYTCKTAAALIAYCREGRFDPDGHVLFWHTGGLMALL